MLLVSHVPASEILLCLLTSRDSLLASLDSRDSLVKFDSLVESLLPLSFLLSLFTLFSECLALPWEPFTGVLGYKAFIAAPRVSYT